MNNLQLETVALARCGRILVASTFSIETPPKALETQRHDPNSQRHFLSPRCAEFHGRCGFAHHGGFPEATVSWTDYLIASMTGVRAHHRAGTEISRQPCALADRTLGAAMATV